MDRKEQAMEYFLKGYNCTQAIVLTFRDHLGLDETTALKIASPFGGGMGRMREVCGAFSGILLVLGYLYGYEDVKDPSLKKELYGRVQDLAERFKEVNCSHPLTEGSIVCRELLGLQKGESSDSTPSERTPAYYAKRPCKEIIGNAAAILDAYLCNHPYK